MSEISSTTKNILFVKISKKFEKTHRSFKQRNLILLNMQEEE